MGKAVWLRVAAVVVGGAFAGAGAPAASAWTQVTSSNEANINEVSLARSADGTLHVAWTRPSAGTGAADDLLQTPISATGAVGGST